MNEASVSPVVRVLLVDDSAELRAVWSRLLARTAGLEVAAAVGTIGEILPEIDRTRPQIVVLDLFVDGADTAGFIGPITRAGTRVIAYSGRDGERLAAALRAQGAAGFVSKHEEPSVLLDAIRRVASGGVHFPSRLTV